MISVRINGDARKWPEEADEHWVTQQINRQRAAGQSVCVRVTITSGPVDVTLSTPGCPAGAGGYRPLRPQEQEVLSLWSDRHLNDTGFTGGDLVAFLKQVGRAV